MGDEFCCPSGQKRCGQSSKCYNPATQQCCEGNGLVWGCLKTETCCSLGGATACVDPVAEQCCPGGTCLKTNTCCGKQCCASLSVCGADGYCTAKPITTTSRATTSTTTSSTTAITTIRSTTTTTSSSSSSTITTTTTTSTTTTTTTSSTTTRSSAKPTETEEPEEPDEPDLPDCQLLRRNLPSGCPSECHNGKELPVLNYEYRPGENDEIVFSMCHGIQVRRDDPKYGAQSNDPDRYNYDILTRVYGKQHRDNRNAIKCGGFCAAQKKTFNDSAKLQCDEYPFASTNEGGKPAFRTCVPSRQNSQQGNTLTWFYRKCINPYEQKRFILRIVPGCPQARVKRDLPSSGETSVSKTLAKRAGEQASFILSAWNNSLYSPFSRENGSSYAKDASFNAVPLGNLLNGAYDIKFNSEHIRGGAVSAISVVDNGGEEYGRLNSSTISSVSDLVLRLNITDLDDGDELPAFVVGWAQSSFNMSYSATVTPTNTSAIAPQGAQSTSDSTRLGGSGMAMGIMFLGLALTMLF